MIRSIFRAAKPILSVRAPWKTSFSTVTHTQRIQDIRQVFRIHEQSLKSAQQFSKQFSDEYLLKLVEQNYCFSDLVDICNGLIYHAEPIKSDVQIIFFAYAYNLYYSDLKKGREVILSISKALQSRINGKNYSFASSNVEKHYLTNIKSLSNRYNNFLTNEVATLKNFFVRFLTLKFELLGEGQRFLPTRENTLSQFLAMMPYIPKDSIGCKYLVDLEKQYLQLLRFQTQRFLARPDEDVTKNWMRQTTTRFILVMEIGVMLGKLTIRFINLFTTLPTSFSTEAKFANYLRVIKEFFTYQLLSCLDFEQFDNYNLQLFTNNTAYRSPETLLAFENYAESLILLKKNNLKPYNTYLGYNDIQDPSLQQKTDFKISNDGKSRRDRPNKDENNFE